MSAFARQRRPRVGAVLGRLLDGAPFPTRQAALEYILAGRSRRAANRCLDLAMRRNLLSHLVDGRIVRSHHNPEVPR